MFLRLCSPASTKLAATLPCTCRQASSEIEMPPARQEALLGDLETEVRSAFEIFDAMLGRLFQNAARLAGPL